MMAALALSALAWLGFWNAGLGLGAPTAAFALTGVAWWCSGAALRASTRLGQWVQAGLLGLAVVAAMQLIPLSPSWSTRLAPGASALDVALGRSGGAWALSRDPASTASVVLFLLHAALLISTASWVARTARLRRCIQISLVWAASAMVGLEVVAQVTGTRWLHADTPDHVRPFGPFMNRNHAAAVLLLAAPVAVALWHTARTSASRWGTGALALVCLGGVALNGSRGAAVAAGVALVIASWAYVRHRTLPQRLAATGLATVLASVLAGSAWSRVQEVDTVDQRLTLAADGWQMIQDSPLLGIGLGAFHAAYPPYQSVAVALRFRHAECEPIDLWVEAGGLGLLLGLLIAGAVLTAAWRALWERRDPVDAALAMGVCALAVHACFDFPYRMPGVTAPALLVVACLPRLRSTEGLVPCA